jgi:hypothetical protein
MLIQYPEYRLSQFVKKHFTYMFSLELDTFEAFIETCFFKHAYMIESKPMIWPFKEDEVYRDFHTSYLNSAFESKL